MQVLVVNPGSSSLKVSIVADGVMHSSATVERWDGSPDPVRDFLDGHAGDVEAVGLRVVHGGPRYQSSVRLDESVLAYLESIGDLAPLHNPRAVSAARVIAAVLPRVPAVAAFDTAFHAAIPAAAATYAVPREWNHRFQLRRYGFHGLSHSYAVRRAASIIGRRVEELRIVSCHLGAGGSLCAVREGRSVDTTMGFTPLAGLVMQTRSGSIDPGLMLWLLGQVEMDVEVLGGVLEHESGLKGLSGTSGDLRDVLAARAGGDPDASLAFDVFAHRLVREIGGMATSAGGLDLLVFTGGMGEHSPELRAVACARLAHLGVSLDVEANTAAQGDADITGASTTVHTVVVTAAEDLEIARETERVQRS